RAEEALQEQPQGPHPGQRADPRRHAFPPLHRRPLRPDKAIVLIDEAASKIRIEIDSVPTEIDEVKRRVMQLRIELESLRKEKSDAAKERRKAIESEVSDLEARERAMTEQWEAEKEAIKGISEVKERLE